MEENRGRDLLAFFNTIYQNDIDQKGFELSDREEFQSVLATLELYGMPTGNFLENLKTLGMKKKETVDLFTKANYIPKHNKLTYSDEKYIKHELFHMAASKKGETSGVSFMTKSGIVLGEALNEGITEMFTKLNDPNYKVQYPFEKMVSEVLYYIYDGEELFEHHFRNDSQAFLEALGDVRIGKELLVQLDKFRNSFIQVCDRATNEERFDETEFYQVRFFFEQVLLLLTELFYKMGKKDKKEFQMFVTNGLADSEMEQVKLVVTGLGTKELFDTKFKGKLF